LRYKFTYVSEEYDTSFSTVEKSPASNVSTMAAANSTYGINAEALAAGIVQWV
jgi:hypothetical protein